MKISKKTREAAARMLSAIACGCSWSYPDAAEALGADPEAINLVWKVVMSVDWDQYDEWQHQWAEAEARLRTGWAP